MQADDVFAAVLKRDRARPVRVLPARTDNTGAMASLACNIEIGLRVGLPGQKKGLPVQRRSQTGSAPAGGFQTGSCADGRLRRRSISPALLRWSAHVGKIKE